MAGLQKGDPLPTEIKLHQRSRILEITFDDGQRFELSYEFLRVHSPSAEVRGHGPGEEVLQLGKRDVEIVNVEPVGNYAIRPIFSDGHDSGLYSWDYLYEIGERRDELWQTYDSMSRWPQMRHVNLVVRLADPGAQSVGESRSRFLCYRFHLPRPELQYPVYDGDVLVGISDMVWHGCRLLGEFDGRVKYGRLLKPGESASDVVFQEKRREDRMREITSYGMFRFVWHDVDQEPARAAERLRRALFGRAA